MKGQRKLIESRFVERIAAVRPQFKKVKCDGLGNALVLRSVELSTSCYLILFSDPFKYKFTLHIACMLDGQSPAKACYGKPFQGRIDSPGVSFALSNFWSDHDCPWLIRDEFEETLAEEDLMFDIYTRFTKEAERKWIADHPDLYTEPLDDDQINVFVRVDHMVEMVETYAIPYFREMSAKYRS